MASLLTHPIVPLAAAALVGRSVVPLPLVALGIVFALLPLGYLVRTRFAPCASR